MSLKVELTPANNNKGGLSVTRAIDYVTRAKDFSLLDNGEGLFALVFEIWETARKHSGKG